MENVKGIIKNPHFWLVGFLTLLITLLYSAWPWLEWKYSDGILKWIGWHSVLFNLALFELNYHLVGSLYLIPIIYSSIYFKIRGSIIVSFLAVVGLFPLLNELWFSISGLLTNISLLLLPIVVVLIIKIELELRHKDKRIYQEREKAQREYLVKILDTQERERKHLAEALHDDSVQNLLAVSSYAELIETDKSGNIKEIQKKAKWIRITTLNTVKDLRRLSIELRPGILDTMGLIPSLNWLIEQNKNNHNITFTLNTSGIETKLHPSVEVIIFRVIQEAIQNIKRHSKATEAAISIAIESNSLKVTIQDNGCGFTPPTMFAGFIKLSKLGLLGMRERVNSLGGNFEIVSQPGEGTLLNIEIPIKPPTK